MELQARVKEVLPIENGTSKSGNAWSKATVIVETLDPQYPKTVCLSNMKKAEEFAQLKPGHTFNFSYDLDSREFNGKWYTSVNCYAWSPA